jgi:hypothetical protein
LSPKFLSLSNSPNHNTAAVTTDSSPESLLDLFEFYERMERNKIMLSFKGDITSELLTSVLQIMESKLENMQEEPKIKKKVYNVLVECLQNLYHHLDVESGGEDPAKYRSAIFMIGKIGAEYSIYTGNYIFNENVPPLRDKLNRINVMSKDELKEYYKEILNNDEFSQKGGGGLGMIDIARKSGQKLNFQFMPVDNRYSFFSLNIKIS